VAASQAAFLPTLCPTAQSRHRPSPAGAAAPMVFELFRSGHIRGAPGAKTELDFRPLKPACSPSRPAEEQRPEPTHAVHRAWADDTPPSNRKTLAHASASVALTFLRTTPKLAESRSSISNSFPSRKTKNAYAHVVSRSKRASRSMSNRRPSATLCNRGRQEVRRGGGGRAAGGGLPL